MHFSDMSLVGNHSALSIWLLSLLIGLKGEEDLIVRCYVKVTIILDSHAQATAREANTHKAT